MSGQNEGRSEQGGVRVAQRNMTYEAYASARERFFAALRRDAEIRRLERLWRIGSEEREPAR